MTLCTDEIPKNDELSSNYKKVPEKNTILKDSEGSESEFGDVEIEVLEERDSLLGNGIADKESGMLFYNFYVCLEREFNLPVTFNL